MKTFVKQVEKRLNDAGFRVGYFETENDYRLYINAIPRVQSELYKEAKCFLKWSKGDDALIPESLDKADSGIASGATLISHARRCRLTSDGKSVAAKNAFIKCIIHNDLAPKEALI